MTCLFSLATLTYILSTYCWMGGGGLSSLSSPSLYMILLYLKYPPSYMSLLACHPHLHTFYLLLDGGGGSLLCPLLHFT
jgi:hypothetical protein